MAETQKTRDSRGRFLPKGGEERGGKDVQLVQSLRARLAKLIASPTSTSREIGVLTRALLSAQSVELIQKQIALADQKLAGKSEGLDLEQVARTMAAMDAEYDRAREAAEKVP